MGGTCSKQLDESPLARMDDHGLTLANGTKLLRSEYDTHNQRLHVHKGRAWALGTDECGRMTEVLLTALGVALCLACCSCSAVATSGLSMTIAGPLYLLIVVLTCYLVSAANGPLWWLGFKVHGALRGIGVLRTDPTLNTYYRMVDDEWVLRTTS